MKVSEQNAREIRAWDAAYAKGFAEGQNAASLPGAGAGEPVDAGLKDQVRPYSETLSAFSVVAQHYGFQSPPAVTLAAAPASPALASMPGEEEIARTIMVSRDGGGCSVKDWTVEARDNPHVAQALRQARAVLALLAPEGE